MKQRKKSALMVSAVITYKFEFGTKNNSILIWGLDPSNFNTVFQFQVTFCLVYFIYETQHYVRGFKLEIY